VTEPTTAGATVARPPGREGTGQPLLEVKNLKVHFPTADGLVKAVDGLSFTVDRGETLGVVGESGSGKSVSFMTVMGLITSKQANIEGEVLFKGQDLLKLPVDEMRHIRGKEMGMVFQDPMTSLHPFYKVGDQIAEAVRAHEKISKKAANALAVDMLRRVGIPKPDERARQYPHEFSGGMRQRSMIAMALVLNPDLLIADEPTTALDVTVQAQILDLIDRLKTEFNAAVAIITHDLGVVAEHCDAIQVMYAGKIVEMGGPRDIYYDADHPYTWGLLQSIPRLDSDEDERLKPIKGLPPSLIFVPPGCAFHPRCPYVMDVCRTEVPALLAYDGLHASACHLPLAEKQRIFQEQVLGRHPEAVS
jgi:peptide/nickel transport system ATP-binding protein